MAEIKTTATPRKRKPKAETVQPEPKVEEVTVELEVVPEESVFMSRRARRRAKLREMFGITEE